MIPGLWLQNVHFSKLGNLSWGTEATLGKSKTKLLFCCWWVLNDFTLKLKSHLPDIYRTVKNLEASKMCFYAPIYCINDSQGWNGYIWQEPGLSSASALMGLYCIREFSYCPWIFFVNLKLWVWDNTENSMLALFQKHYGEIWIVKFSFGF